MPYINKKARKLLTEDIAAEGVPTSAGELNYTLTQEILLYLREHKLSYQTCNDIVGALDNCKDEFRRRIQHPYEDEKIRENGDIDGYSGRIK